jgi:hypothetical protein
MYARTVAGHSLKQHFWTLPCERERERERVILETLLYWLASKNPNEQTKKAHDQKGSGDRIDLFSSSVVCLFFWPLTTGGL